MCCVSFSFETNVNGIFIHLSIISKNTEQPTTASKRQKKLFKRENLFEIYILLYKTRNCLFVYIFTVELHCFTELNRRMKDTEKLKYLEQMKFFYE